MQRHDHLLILPVIRRGKREWEIVTTPMRDLDGLLSFQYNENGFIIMKERMLPATLTQQEQKILLFLSRYPQQQLYSSQIARRADISVGGSHQTLRKLLARKLVSREREGNMVFYRINPHHPLVKQIKVTEVVARLSRLVEKLKDCALEVVLFGSAARGEQTADSDIDLFILAHQVPEVKAMMARERSGMKLAPVIKTPHQWMAAEHSEPEFHHEVTRGITLYRSHE